MSSLNYENPGFKNKGFDFLDEKIFIKKNVLPNEYMLLLTNTISKLSESDWIQHGNYEIGDLPPEESFIQDKVSPPIPMVHVINDIIEDLFVPEYWGVKNLFMNRLSVGQKPQPQLVNTISENGEKKFDIDYIATIPVGTWTGGDYFFPKKNITVTLNPGDLLVFGGDLDYEIHVQEITAGTRYASFMPIVKHPPWLIL